MKKNSVLLIGSGLDLNGRRLGSSIDRGRFGLVARCNFLYGNPADSGHRTDFLFTRWAAWLDKIPPALRFSVKHCIILNEKKGISEAEYKQTLEEVGQEHVSCGTLAAAWLLRRGFRVSAIGVGFSGGAFLKEKRYPDGKKDDNTHYNWAAENRWLANNVTLF